MNTDCIEHKQKSATGYGVCFHKKKQQRIHRVAYVLHHGLSIEDIRGKVIRHTCDNPRCINPLHLLAGTQADNMRDLAVRRRNGFLKLTEEQVAEIRATCKPGKRAGPGVKPFSYQSFARKFGVDVSSVRAAFLKKTFRHLP